MKHLQTIFILLVLLPIISKPQPIFDVAYTHNHINSFSFQKNQASLATIKNSSAGIFAERRFILNELSNYTAGIALKTSKGNIGIKLHRTGFNLFSENIIGFAHARSLGSNVNVGLQFNYYSMQIPGYTGLSGLIAEAAALFQLSDKVHAGLQFYRPATGNKLENKTDPLLQRVSIGVGFDPSPRFMVELIIVKVAEQSVTVDATMLYQIEKAIKLSGRVSTSTSAGWGGVEFALRKYKLGLSVGFHPYLGLSPGLSFQIDFNKAT